MEVDLPVFYESAYLSVRFESGLKHKPPGINMYNYLLPLHSWMRWLVLASLLFTVVRAYNGWRKRQGFSTADNAARHWMATIAQIQLLLGLWLYYISPITGWFLSHFKEAVHQREVRFFGMEHSLMMVLAVVIITLGSMKAKRQTDDAQKFKTVYVWYGIALLVILSSVPWSFSPLVSRPSWRAF